ncbi:MAG TPA: hypothetical protein VFO67_08140, partial [Gemmatimonadales bacterium]|nr:hypothetical protein [Gemmatimonadales bacterium]
MDRYSAGTAPTADSKTVRSTSPVRAVSMIASLVARDPSTWVLGDQLRARGDNPRCTFGIDARNIQWMEGSRVGQVLETEIEADAEPEKLRQLAVPIITVRVRRDVDQ